MVGDDDGIRETAWISCSHGGCDQQRPDHQWGSRGKYSGWFVQKDGTSWCPDHVPDWVEEWRAKRQ